MSAVQDLASIIGEQVDHQSPQADCVTCADVNRAAAAVDTMGYRKPVVLAYVVVDRLGVMIGSQSATRAEAQAVADEWTTTCKEAGIDWDYRVAEIVEAAP